MAKLLYIFALVFLCAITAVRTDLQCYVCSNCETPSQESLQTCGVTSTSTTTTTTTTPAPTTPASSTTPAPSTTLASSTTPASSTTLASSTTPAPSNTIDTSEADITTTAIPDPATTPAPSNTIDTSEADTTTAIPAPATTPAPSNTIDTSEADITTTAIPDPATTPAPSNTIDTSEADTTTAIPAPATTPAPSNTIDTSEADITTTAIPASTAADGTRKRRHVLAADEDSNKGCICYHGKCDCSSKFGSRAILRASTFQCYTHKYEVNGTDVVDRGCQEIPQDSSSMACDILGFSAGCTNCDTDKCNSAFSIQFSMAMLICTLCMLLL